jgi:multidrug efflux pump subunit AcrA (membrane-fusion protein)
MRKILKYLIPTALAVIVFLAGLYHFNTSGKQNQSRSEASNTNWQVCKVQLGDISDRITIAGKLQPATSASVAGRVTGRIKKIMVNEGDSVEQGQVLVHLNEMDLKGKIESNRVKYLKALSKLKDTQNWESSPVYLTAKLQLANAQHDLEEAKRTYDENLMLFEQRAISKSDLRQSELELKRNNTALQTATNQFADQTKKGDKTALREAQAEHDAALIDLKDAEEVLNYKDITAPCAGIVSFVRSSSIKPGSNDTVLIENRPVAPGEILLKIESNTQFVVEGRLNEYDVYRVLLDQPCEIRVPALPEATFEGTVAEIYPITSRDSRAYFQIRCPINQTDESLKAGLSAEIEIILKEKTGTLLIPISALAIKSGKKGVFVIKNGTPVFNTFEVGIKTKENVEVVSGLSEGQDILCSIPLELLTANK